MCKSFGAGCVPACIYVCPGTWGFYFRIVSIFLYWFLCSLLPPKGHPVCIPLWLWPHSQPHGQPDTLGSSPPPGENRCPTDSCGSERGRWPHHRFPGRQQRKTAQGTIWMQQEAKRIKTQSGMLRQRGQERQLLFSTNSLPTKGHYNQLVFSHTVCTDHWECECPKPVVMLPSIMSALSQHQGWCIWCGCRRYCWAHASCCWNHGAEILVGGWNSCTQSWFQLMLLLFWYFACILCNSLAGVHRSNGRCTYIRFFTYPIKQRGEWRPAFRPAAGEPLRHDPVNGKSN